VQSGKPAGVVITGIDIPFWHLVALFVKIALAAIPALVILCLMWAACTVIFWTIFGPAITDGLHNAISQFALPHF
jgi:hypothetical protein